MVTTPPNYCHTITSPEGPAPYHIIHNIINTQPCKDYKHHSNSSSRSLYQTYLTTSSAHILPFPWHATRRCTVQTQFWTPKVHTISTQIHNECQNTTSHVSIFQRQYASEWSGGLDTLTSRRNYWTISSTWPWRHFCENRIAAQLPTELRISHRSHTT
jgi:hypothetical protein